MKIIVSGSGGQLGTALKRSSADKKGLEFVFAGRDGLDITERDSIDRYLTEHSDADAVINCAAYTDVEKAEDEKEKAYSVNRYGPANLVTAASVRGMKTVHISTDFVFSGSKGSAYNENDIPDPVSAYGKSKYEGELEALKFSKNVMIIRTSWLYCATHNTFMRKIYDRAKKGDILRVVSDETGSPTRAGDLADAIIKIIMRREFSSDFASVIYHYCNSGSVSRFEYAKKIVEYSGFSAQVVPVLSKELNMKAKRPSFSALDCSKIIRDCRLDIRPWQQALKEETDAIGRE